MNDLRLAYWHFFASAFSFTHFNDHLFGICLFGICLFGSGLCVQSRARVDSTAGQRPPGRGAGGRAGGAGGAGRGT